MVNFLLISILITAYLIYMSTEDIKTKTVPVLPSNLFILILFGSYFANCVYFGKIPDIFALMIGTLLLILFVKRRMFIGSADAKALYICFMASPYMDDISVPFSWSNILDPFIPAMVYLLSALPFVVYLIIHGIKNRYSFKEIFLGKGERTAFFPFLLIGFMTYVSFRILLCHFA